MKIANPTYDVVFKYLMENDDLAKDILLDVFNQKKYKTTDSHILEYTGNTTDPKIARVVKHLGRAIANNPDLLYAMVMEDLMEAEAERERNEREQSKQKLKDAENAKIKIQLENEQLKEEVEALRLQLQNKNNTPSV
jgi:phospholipase/lecithinase/hemolysin